MIVFTNSNTSNKNSMSTGTPVIDSLYKGPPLPPKTENGPRSISTKNPLYDRNMVIQLAKGTCTLTVVTRKCVADMARINKDLKAIRQDIISDLNKSKFEGSEWCFTSRKTWGASDSYEIFHNIGLERYYLKYYLSDNKDILTVSCHI